MNVWNRIKGLFVSADQEKAAEIEVDEFKPELIRYTIWTTQKQRSAVKSIARRERFSKKGYSAVARALLQFAIDEYEAGDAVVQVSEHDGMFAPYLVRKR